MIFEITETALMGDIEAGEAFAKGLTDLGCGLALDDFGTGFGSFTYLKRLPIGLPQDRHRVRTDLLTNPANQHLVRAIVSLAKAFNLQTIAEGVEDEETWDFLRQEGVDFGKASTSAGPPRSNEWPHTVARVPRLSFEGDEVLRQGAETVLRERPRLATRHYCWSLPAICSCPALPSQSVPLPGWSEKPRPLSRFAERRQT